MTGLVDLHSHHLPGVDDGPRTLSDAVTQVRRLGEVGYETLVTTPHVIEGRYEYGTDEICGWVARLQEAVGPAPRLLPGAEHRFDDRFLRLMDARTLTPLGGSGRTVLVEFAWPKLPPHLLDVLYRIQVKGYLPLLAHPDRYDNDEHDFARLRAWVERGGLLQIELGSLVGRYGDEARDACRRLLSEGLAQVACGDVHGPGDVERQVEAGLKALAREVGRETAERLCRDNPLRLLRGAA